MNTVTEQFEGYTKQEVEKAQLLHELKVMLGHPIDHKYKYMVSNRLLLSFPITTHDITNANYMFGTDLEYVGGNTVIKKSSRVDTE